MTCPPENMIVLRHCVLVLMLLVLAPPPHHILQGDPSVPPAPPPRRGPRQLLSSLLGLADLCPEEWPSRGASQLAARNRDAADAQGRTLEGGSFATIASSGWFSVREQLEKK